VFDAGSTHTSAFVYQWPGNERLRGTAVPVYEIYHATQDPGEYVNLMFFRLSWQLSR
jgi:hypothetical protein